MSEDTEQESKPGINSLREILRKLEEAGAPVRESPAKVVRRLSRYVGAYPERNLAVDICDQRFAETAEQALERFRSCCVPKPLGSSGFFFKKKPPSLLPEVATSTAEPL